MQKQKRLKRQHGLVHGGAITTVEPDKEAEEQRLHELRVSRLENYMLNRGAVFPLVAYLSFYIDTAARVPMYTGDSASVSA